MKAMSIGSPRASVRRSPATYDSSAVSRRGALSLMLGWSADLTTSRPLAMRRAAMGITD
ncbi:MAG: hypothetical protein RXQ79_06130 [Acidilobus sp.]